MIAVELGSSTRAARLVFAGLLVSILVFGSIAVGLRQPFALLLCAVSVVGAVRLGMVLRRRSRARDRATTVARGRTSVVVHDGLFTVRGRYSTGGRSREGLLLIGPERAGFIPLGHSRFLILQLLTAPFVAQLHFVDLEIETTSGGVDPAIADAVDRHAGLLIEPSWTYMAAQRWLYRPGIEGIVVLDKPLPPDLASRWQVAPALTPERFRWIRNRIAAVTLAVTTTIGLGGLAAWSLSGDSEILVAALFYAGLLGGAVMGAVIFAKRQLLPKS